MGTLAVGTKALQGSPMESHRLNSIISGRSPPLHCKLTLITMEGHQNRSRLVIIQYFWTKSSGTVIFLGEIRLKIGFGPECARPSEHPPVRGEKMSKCLRGVEGCKYKTSSSHINGFPDGNNID